MAVGLSEKMTQLRDNGYLGDKSHQLAGKLGHLCFCASFN